MNPKHKKKKKTKNQHNFLHNQSFKHGSDCFISIPSVMKMINNM